MKKAKVIIPSLALLSFSALACVTGSVAWFSSITNAHVSTSSFAVRAIVGAMDIGVYHGLGTRATLDESEISDDTTIKDASGKVIGYQKSEKIVVVPGKLENGTEYELSHGSYDPATQTAFTYKANAIAKVNDETNAPQDYAHEADNKYLEQGTAGVYNIMTWKMTFDYDFKGAGAGSKNLYIDVGKISFEKGIKTYGPDAYDTARGFRLFFLTMGTDGSVIDWTCISPFQADVLDKNNTAASGQPAVLEKSCYIKNDSGTPTKEYFDTSLYGNLIYSEERDGDNFDISIVDGHGYSDRKDCIGTFSATSLVQGQTYARITIKVVACYEGCDNNVTFESNINKVTSVLDFYVADNDGTHSA